MKRVCFVVCYCVFCFCVFIIFVERLKNKESIEDDEGEVPDESRAIPDPDVLGCQVSFSGVNVAIIRSSLKYLGMRTRRLSG